MSRKIVESVCISDYEKFIDIEGNYGAKQEWLFRENIKSKFWSDRSCGVVAASHCAYYLTKYHNKPLYNYEDLSIKNFTAYLNEVSKFVCPRIYGIPTIYHMRRGFINFAKSKGVKVKAVTIDIKSSKVECIYRLKKALKSNYTVMLINWNSKDSCLRNHWVTVTGYYKDEDNNSFIITSNWGRKQVFNFDKLLEERVFYKGLLYFT